MTFVVVAIEPVPMIRPPFRQSSSCRTARLITRLAARLTTRLTTRLTAPFTIGLLIGWAVEPVHSQTISQMTSQAVAQATSQIIAQATPLDPLTETKPANLLPVAPGNPESLGPTDPATPPIAAIRPPSLITPTLPGLRDPARYLPQNQTIRLLLKLSHRKVYVYQGEKLIASYPVAIGRPEFPTPTGEFQVNEMIVNPSWQSPWTGEVEAPGADGSLGLRWIGFTEVTGGVIGFHGTPNIRSIGQAASHGCVRMRNEDIVKMYEYIELGTRVSVEQ